MTSRFLFIEKSESGLIIATDDAGVFLQSRNETRWTRISHGLPNKKINALCVDHQVIYVAPHRRGIFKSADKGKTWRSVNFDLPDLSVQAIARSDSLFAGTDSGVFELKPGTKSWARLLDGVQVVRIDVRGDLMVAGTNRGTAIAQDGGQTWRWSQDRNAVHYSRIVDGIIVELKLNGDVLLSRDRGETWTQAVNFPRHGSCVDDIVQVRDSLVLSNNYGIHRSGDGGRTWTRVFKTESIACFALLTDGDAVFGGTRTWDEYRKRRR